MENQGPTTVDERDPNPFTSKNVLLSEAMMHNVKQLDLFHIVIYMAGGSIAGILGLTGIKGAAVLFVTALLSALGLLIRVKFDLNSYSNLSFFGLMIQGLSTQWLPFIFFWTFTYTMVHIY
ncbi:hypothetical protein EON65_51625 [archaeon]|nr:MAG: hypothetical protein EON65_51625 [archaeon]